MQTLKLERTKAHQSYVLKNGTRVPGVTTVIGVLQKPALIHWAWQQGVDGKDYRKVRDEAADIGTVVHFMALCHLREAKWDLSDFSPAVIDKAENAFLSFLSWWEKQGMEPVFTELEMVSEKYRCGGTLDLIARKRRADTLHLFDFKSSKGIYEPEHPVQLSAYRKLAEDGYCGHIEDVTLVRLDKEGKDFNPDSDVKTWANCDKHWRMFMLCREIYDLNKELKPSGAW